MNRNHIGIAGSTTPEAFPGGIRVAARRLICGYDEVSPSANKIAVVIKSLYWDVSATSANAPNFVGFVTVYRWATMFDVARRGYGRHRERARLLLKSRRVGNILRTLAARERASFDTFSLPSEFADDCEGDVARTLYLRSECVGVAGPFTPWKTRSAGAGRSDTRCVGMSGVSRR